MSYEQALGSSGAAKFLAVTGASAGGPAPAGGPFRRREVLASGAGKCVSGSGKYRSSGGDWSWEPESVGLSSGAGKYRFSGAGKYWEVFGHMAEIQNLGSIHKPPPSPLSRLLALGFDPRGGRRGWASSRGLSITKSPSCHKQLRLSLFLTRSCSVMNVSIEDSVPRRKRIGEDWSPSYPGPPRYIGNVANVSVRSQSPWERVDVSFPLGQIREMKSIAESHR